MSKKDDIELEIQDVVEEEKAAIREDADSIKQQTKKTGSRRITPCRS